MDRHRLARQSFGHPLMLRAANAAIAAAAAYLVVLALPLGSAAEKYPYYAPLGAVIAVSRTVTRSVRGSLQSLLALGLGAGVAGLVHLADLQEILGLAIVVAVGTLFSGLRILGDSASWVPIAGILVLIVGRNDPVPFVLGYVGLTALGALVGIGVNLLLPPLPLSHGDQAIHRLRAALSAQLGDLAEGLRAEDAPSTAEWERRRHRLEPTSREMGILVADAAESRRANWRAARWQQTADRQYDLAVSLQQLFFLVEQVTRLLMAEETSDRDLLALGPRLRPVTADLLEAMADVLDAPEGETEGETYPDRLRAADAAMAELVRVIREVRRTTDDDLFTAGTVVTVIRQALIAVVPQDLAEELPSRS